MKGTRWYLLIGVVLAGWSASPEALALTWEEVFVKAAPGVVAVNATCPGCGGRFGTGSILTSQGLVLTNAHVILNKEMVGEPERPYPRITVSLYPGRTVGKAHVDLARRHRAQVLGFNTTFDLALLKIDDPPLELSTLQLANPDTVRIGQAVVAIGHPEQGGFWSLTQGVVSAIFEDYRNRKDLGVFQTSASLNRGNSGGPLLNNRGNMVGVNTWVARIAHGADTQSKYLSKDTFFITDVNFSTKANVVRTWLREQGVDLEFAMPLSNVIEQPPEEPMLETPNITQLPPHVNPVAPPVIPTKPDDIPETQEPPLVHPSQEPTTPDSLSDGSEEPLVKPQGPILLTKPHPYKEEEVLEWYARVEQDLEQDMDEMEKELERFR